MASPFDYIKKAYNWTQDVYKQTIGLFKSTTPVPLKLPAPHVEAHIIDGTKQGKPHPCPNYMGLKMRFRDIGRMNGIVEALGRDFLTAMPEGAYKSRLGQIAFLARRMHEDLANSEMSKLIENAHSHEKSCPEEWDAWDRANLHEMETMYRHHCRVSADLMERRAHMAYEGRRRHRQVLRDNDWLSAQKFLQEMIDLQREIAESKCLIDNDHKTDATYQALLREYIPGARLDDIDRLFGQMEEKLEPLLPKILEKQAQEAEPEALEGPFDPTLQLWLNQSLLKVLGFDFDRGGLYETGHNPVEGGTPDDTRLVIKTSDTEDFMESMKSALHEGGHGIYIQGLPRTEWRYQPVGQDLGAAVQESQALLVEMIFGRMPEFFEYLSPRVEGLFQKFGNTAMAPENLYRLKTRVAKSVDRKHADEVTYFYHINMRMKLERDLIAGRLAVADLPDAWNAEVKKFTGKEPTSNAEGCLQDVHWFVGKFGYFPSYTLGHMMAAQMHCTMKRDIQDMPELIKTGQFKPIRQWLNANIHEKGRLFRTDELLEDVTGSHLSVTPLINHFEERYLNAA